jgi:hypothetical protein
MCEPGCTTEHDPIGMVSCRWVSPVDPPLYLTEMVEDTKPRPVPRMSINVPPSVDRVPVAVDTEADSKARVLVIGVGYRQDR